MKHFGLIVLSLLLATACSARGSGLEISDAWARPASEGANSAAYFTIDNQGARDALISASSPIALRTEIHRSSIDSEGVMRMEQQQSVSIPADDHVLFEPGGLHVMLIGLNRELVDGDTFDLQLVFENHGELLIDVPVQFR